MCKNCGCGETPKEKEEIYECEDCGRKSKKRENCCGKPMKNKE
jgi:hypothetical protein